MTRKFSEARRAAFLRAVAETGNQGLAAARAKVSRTWVTMTRHAEPAFDAAVRDAVEAFKASALTAPLVCTRDERGTDRRTLKPPTGWGTLDGVQLVVRGTGGSAPRHAADAAARDERRPRRVQIARSRLKQWDPDAEDRFLATLAATCNVKAACAAVGLSAPGAYAHRHRWQGFAARWDVALEEGYRRLEAGLLEAGANLFSGREQPDAATVGPMTVDQAIQLLALHQYQVRNVGKPMGRRPRRRTLDEVRASILRKLEAIDRMDEETVERLMAERHGGPATRWGERAG